MPNEFTSEQADGDNSDQGEGVDEDCVQDDYKQADQEDQEEHAEYEDHADQGEVRQLLVHCLYHPAG